MNIINFIKEVDTQLFLFLNSKHNSFFDSLMHWASHKLVWIPLYAFFLYLVFKHFGKKIIWVALAAVLLIVLSDQISVHAFKNVFLRYRPCHNLLLQTQIHINGNCGGTYGFISSHAANTFALAMFLFLIFKSKIKYFGVFLFTWATLVSYSRIYNGVHYPADILGGAIVGSGIASLVFIVYKKVSLQIQNKS